MRSRLRKCALRKKRHAMHCHVFLLDRLRLNGMIRWWWSDITVMRLRERNSSDLPPASLMLGRTDGRTRLVIRNLISEIGLSNASVALTHAIHDYRPSVRLLDMCVCTLYAGNVEIKHGGINARSLAFALDLPRSVGRAISRRTIAFCAKVRLDISP